MEMFSLTCPHCSFSKELQIRALPPLGTKTTCPRCKGLFQLDDECLTPRPQPADTPVAADGSTSGPCPVKEETWLAPTPPDQLGSLSLPERTLSFTFTGNAREYFGIWVVNTLLRIVTLGLYSPWAKVRKRRYFYGNTFLNDAPFDYLADPMAILKGWLLAGAFFGLYSLASQVSPLLAVAFMFALFALFPWVLVRSLMFNRRNSSHRNIRFAFRPDYREAYKVFLWWQLLATATLGILAPYAAYRQKRFLAENSSYGTTFFTFHATRRQYYRIFIPLFIMVPLLAGSFFSLSFLASKEWAANPYLSLLPVVLIPIIYLAIGIYLPTALANLTWNSTGIGDHRFVSTLRVRDLLWIYFSNSVAIVFSLGLLAPWASVRLARYRLGKLALCGAGDLDSITASAAETVGATGEELGDMLGFDFGL